MSPEYQPHQGSLYQRHRFPRNDGEDRDKLELTGVQDAMFMKMGKYSTHIKVTTYIYQASFAGERAATVDNPQKGTRRREDGVVENPGRYSGWQDEIVVPARCRKKLR